MLKVVIERFLPLLYHHYGKLNIHYSDGYKKYQSYLRKRQTNAMLNQDLFDECEKISNSPPKRVHNETLKTQQKSVRSLQIDLQATL